MYLPPFVVGGRICLWHWRRKPGVGTLLHMGFGARIFPPSGPHLEPNVAIGDFSVLEVANSVSAYIGQNIGFARGVYLSVEKSA